MWPVRRLSPCLNDGTEHLKESGLDMRPGWYEFGVMGKWRVAGRPRSDKEAEQEGTQRHPRTKSTRKEKSLQVYFTSPNVTILTSTVSMTLSQAFFWFGVDRMLGEHSDGTNWRTGWECFDHITGKVMCQQSHSTRQLEWPAAPTWPGSSLPTHPAGP